VRVVRLGRNNRSEAVALLERAFAGYPVMRYVLGEPEGAGASAQVGALLGHFYDRRLLRGWPLIGIRERGRLLGAALVSEPGQGTWPRELLWALEWLRLTIGSDALHRLERYERGSDRSPAEPHHTLGVLGVLPEAQGRGLSRLLMREVFAVAERHPESRGVCLNTETASNVDLYLHLGFEVIGESDVEGLHSWCLYRRNPVRSPDVD